MSRLHKLWTHSKTWLGLSLLFLLAVRIHMVTLPPGALFSPKSVSDDEIQAIEDRIAPARKFLPSHGDVGVTSAGMGEDAGANGKMFMIIKYVIPPCVAIDSTDEPTVVGCFNSYTEAEAAARNAGMHIAKDFENGVYVFRKDGQ